jgi:TRAP-type transport system periplasmic protein
MVQHPTRRAVIAAAALLLPFKGLAAAEPLRFRVSLDTAPTHERNIAVADYLKKLEEASGGQLKGEVFASGALFRDRDIAKALRQGGAEMAVPGEWVLPGFVPDTDIKQHPIFFGQSADAVHKVMDGPVGVRINEQLDSKIGVKVLGPWLDLGFSHHYTASKPIKDFKDLAGLKIRNSGGAGQAERSKFYKSLPIMTAWPDVPLALSQGNFDGLISTHESLNSAKLWESGVKHCFETREFFGQYVPMVSETFWKKLTPEQQKMMLDLWKQNVGTYRARAAEAQAKGREVLISHGVDMVVPTPEQFAAVQKQMLPTYDEVTKVLHLTPELVKEAASELAAIR